MEAVVEMPVKTVVMVETVMMATGGRGAGGKRGKPESGDGGESESEFLHDHLLSLCDAIRCGWVRGDLESVVSAGWVASIFDPVQSADHWV
jgi:hypothetical protein